MSVRVVARIRPLLDDEYEKDVIVHADSKEGAKNPNIVKIPNPKNEAEEFSFAFNGVYDQDTTQDELFTAEVAPHMKALFQGIDVTLFAYGVTGTGKTHTMRGGLRLADRGVIPRLLSYVFRRGKKIAKDTNEATTVDVALSYYEIYNDKVFDLLEPIEKRTPSGLPLREANGKTIVVGLSEQPCGDLKDFEKLYIEANNNRVTAATKLNAHSSRSHAILRVKVTQTTGDQVLESTASAIDLAGSEDNRRTENNRERLVESAAINKSLFVLSQCVDAISRGDKRIPYRESKMTRILSLGQNSGITVMILNLAPIRSYHLDTLSSLNVSSRAKRIEVREIENEVVFKQPPRAMTLGGTNIQRQPLRPLTNAHNVHTGTMAKEKAAAEKEKDKPVKLFTVFSDRNKPAAPRPTVAAPALQPRTSNILKRRSDASDGPARPSKLMRPSATSRPAPLQPYVTMTAAQIEEMVERKVQEYLASRAATAESQPKGQPATVHPSQPAEISQAVQRRLEALERKIDDRRDENDSGSGKSEGMRLLLQARKLKERGDDEGVLRCYEGALKYFPGQAKLMGKIEKMKAKIAGKSSGVDAKEEIQEHRRPAMRKTLTKSNDDGNDQTNESDYNASEADADESYVDPVPSKAKSRSKTTNKTSKAPKAHLEDDDPRTQKLLDIVNSRDVDLIKSLHGFGAKKARDLVEGLDAAGRDKIESLAQLGLIRGMGERVVERAWEGLAV
ncbi:Kinesin-like protein KIF22 [Cytospora mali]|uniref:Kinesin-like protein KIF22 n=1 Tax=Cytospora mali TaxID=578113 RepID=A0A194W6L0_CYTMA|nr:Kinesin-like protein KIF22 [Valsa mali]